MKVAHGRSTAVLLSDRISLGVLAEIFPREVIEGVLTESGRRERRSRLLPAYVMVRFCLAMCLFFDNDYEEVMRKLVASLKAMGAWRDDWKVPSTSALTQARQRLGSEPLRLLFEQRVVPLAKRGAKGAWCGSRRLMTVERIMIDVPDTPENNAEFGRESNGAALSDFPRVLAVVLAEWGSGAIVGAALDGCHGSERKLAERVAARLAPDTLVVSDHDFYSFALWGAYLRTGADLLWRVNAGLELPVVESLPDGSYTSVVCQPMVSDGRRVELVAHARDGIGVDPEEGRLVRVVDYAVPGRADNGRGDIVRLLTSILDPADVTAAELATTHHERWECKGLVDEIKAHGSARVLRSKSPDMVRQEIWAVLLTHYGIRRLMSKAADEIDEIIDHTPSAISVHVLRRYGTSR